MHELLLGQPVMNVDSEVFHLRERRHAAAYGEEREISEDADESWQFAHNAAPDAASGACARGRCHRIASRPTAISVVSTD